MKDTDFYLKIAWIYFPPENNKCSSFASKEMRQVIAKSIMTYRKSNICMGNSKQITNICRIFHNSDNSFISFISFIQKTQCSSIIRAKSYRMTHETWFYAEHIHQELIQ